MSESSKIFVGRQPILDRRERVTAYEILFRDSAESQTAVFDLAQTAAARVMANTFASMGVDAVLGRYTGFFNVDRDTLMGDIIEALPRERVMVELLETIEVDESVIKRCHALRSDGFSLALDDWVFRDPRSKLLPLVDCVKVDLMGVPDSKLPQLTRGLRRHKAKLLAEKVETRDQFERCHKLGFDLFQGFYFAKPTIISGEKIDPAQAALLDLIQQVRQDVDVVELAEAFKQNSSLGVSLLRVVNSSAFARSRKVSQVRDALTYLGRRHLGRWLNILLFAGEGVAPLHNPLLHTASKRGRVMELLAPRSMACKEVVGKGDGAFLVGMLSLVDALLSQPKESIVSQMNLDDDISKALLRNSGPLGRLLLLTQNLEQADFDAVSELGDELGLTAEEIFNAELEASSWVCELGASLS